MNKTSLKVKNILLTCLLVGNLLYTPSVVYAEFNIPEIPTAPTVPLASDYTSNMPTAPTALVAPTVPAAPTVPTSPTSIPTVTKPTLTIVSLDNRHKSVSPNTSSTNTGNGSGSTNKSNNTTSNDTTIDVANNADVVNNIEVDIVTGGNEANKNMGSGIITTGNATIDGVLLNNINNTIINLNDGCGGCLSSLLSENSKNGSDSTNTADTSNKTNTSIGSTNNLYLVNNESIGASTGYNDTNKNVGDGVIVSGDADVVFTTVNLGNNTSINPTVVNFNIVDTRSEDLYITFPVGISGTSGDGSRVGATNTGNGSNSTNSASSTNNATTTLGTGNNLILDNNINLYADTGGNEANKNMGSGTIETGDANIVSNLVNFLNNTFIAGAEFLIATVNIFGDMSGDIILPREADLTGCGCASDITAANTSNGADSTNTSEATANNKLTINQTNNVIINTNLNIDANTGGNSADKNMGDTSITTGDVNVNSNLVTVANTNTVGSGDTWWLVIINNQGTYTGRIIGADDAATIDGSGLEFRINPDGSIYTLNSNNGAGSTNNASSTVNNSNTINQTNNAVINNNINIKANTGNNTADANMGGASITTGDVSVASNIVNFINNNFIGKKFVLVFVNIFGIFSGNIIPPDQEIPGAGGPTNQTAPQVNLPAGTTLSEQSGGGNSSKSRGISSFTGGIGGGGGRSVSLAAAFEEGGEVLEQGAFTDKTGVVQKIVNNNNNQKSGFSYNFLLLGGALLVVVSYALIRRRLS